MTFSITDFEFEILTRDGLTISLQNTPSMADLHPLLKQSLHDQMIDQFLLISYQSYLKHLFESACYQTSLCTDANKNETINLQSH